MEFEFDPQKSAANLAKHGIDFAEAQRLWNDPRLYAAPVLTHDESRTTLTGRIDDLTWTAVVTRRGDNIRIISVRRARRNEVKLYERQ